MTPPTPLACGDFTGFYSTEFRRLRALAWSLTGDGEQALDIVQTAMSDAFARWDDISSRDRPDLWVRRMVINRCATHRRDRHREKEKFLTAVHQPKGTAPEFSLATLNFVDMVRWLPDLQRSVVTLHYLDDLPVVDIATTLDVTEGTVKTSLHRARQALAHRLAQEGDNHD